MSVKKRSENYAPIYFKKNRNRSMYVPFFLAPWLLGSLQLRKNRFSVRWERTGFLYSLAWDLLLLKRRKRDEKKTLQLNIYKQINTWELLFDLLQAVVYFFCLKLYLYFTKSCSNHLTFKRCRDWSYSKALHLPLQYSIWWYYNTVDKSQWSNEINH